MRRVRLVLLILAAFLLTGSAFADSVSMQLTGLSGNNGGGVYTYPYLFTISNGTSTATNVSLICDSFDNEVIVGETWKANVNGLLSGNGAFPNLANYKAAGLIFLGIMNGSINPTTGNWAIWGLFSTNASGNSYYASSGAAGVASWAFGQLGNTNDSVFNGLVLYTPIAGTQSWGKTPQEYIGYVAVPEPGEMALLATLGLFAIGAFVCRKRLGLNLAA